MSSFIRRIFTLITAIAFIGCTSLHSVMPENNTANDPQKPLNQLLKKNQWVYVVNRDGEKLLIELSAVTECYIEGKNIKTSAQVHIEKSDIIRIEKRSFNGGKTALLVVGTTVVLLIAGGMIAGAVAGSAQVSF